MGLPFSGTYPLRPFARHHACRRPLRSTSLSVSQAIRTSVPRANYVEELLRVTALVHDIGHGPFCHFFDDNYLHAFHLPVTRNSDRSSSEIISARSSGRSDAARAGPFAKGEELNPDHIAHVILKEKGKDNSRIPRWLNMLQPVISGSYTADNLDYVLRDPICAASRSARSISADLIHYTMITHRGFTIHKTGPPRLANVFDTSMYLYSNVYYHRTTRAIDIHLRDIFGETMRLIFPHDPRKIWTTI